MNDPPECLVHTVLGFQLPHLLGSGQRGLALQLISAYLDLLLRDVNLDPAEDPGWRNGTELEAECDPEHEPELSGEEEEMSLQDFRIHVFGGLLEVLGEVVESWPEDRVYDVSEQLSEMILRALEFPVEGLSGEQSRDVLEVLSLVISGLGERRSMAEGVMVSLAKLMQSVDCGGFDVLVSLLRALSLALRGNSSPEETVEGLLAEGLWSGSARNYTNPDGGGDGDGDDGDGGGHVVELSAEDLQFVLSPETLELMETELGSVNFVDVTVSRYGEAARVCRPGTVGDVVDIDFNQPPGTRIGGDFWFEIPLDPGVGAEYFGLDYGKLSRGCPGEDGAPVEVPVCGWWSGEEDWVTEGCRPASETPIRELPGGGGYVLECRCTHLTEFAAILRRLNSGSGECGGRDGETEMYFVIGVLYLVLGLGVVVQLARLGVSAHVLQESFFGLVPTRQHVLIVVAVAGRVVSCWWHAEVYELPLGAVAVFSSLPYLLVFWVFSLLIFQWHALVFRFMQSAKDSFRSVRPVFLGVNLGAVVVIGTLFGMILSDPESEVAEDTALYGSIVMGVLTLVLGVAFLWYGRKVSVFIRDTGSKGAMHRSTGGSRGTDPVEGRRSGWSRLRRLLCCGGGGSESSGEGDVAGRMWSLARITAACFILSAGFWILSVAVESQQDVFRAAFFAVDILALLAVLALYAPFIRKRASDASATRTASKSTAARDFTRTSLGDQVELTHARAGEAFSVDAVDGWDSSDDDDDDDFDSD